MLLQQRRRKLLLQILKEARLEAGMRQVDVAKVLNRPQSYVAKIESGERKIDFIEVLEFTKALGLDPVSLVKKLT
jgi:transcriptional regulator with XRE-family HTH domain